MDNFCDVADFAGRNRGGTLLCSKVPLATQQSAVLGRLFLLSFPQGVASSDGRAGLAWDGLALDDARLEQSGWLALGCVLESAVRYYDAV